MAELGPEPKYRYLVSFIIPIAAIIGNYIGGYYSASAIIIALGIFPILDHLSGQISQPRPPHEHSKILVAMLYAHGIINPPHFYLN